MYTIDYFTSFFVEFGEDTSRVRGSRVEKCLKQEATTLLSALNNDNAVLKASYPLHLCMIIRM